MAFTENDAARLRELYVLDKGLTAISGRVGFDPHAEILVEEMNQLSQRLRAANYEIVTARG